jgi:DNA-binding transcriptional MerR regulator
MQKRTISAAAQEVGVTPVTLRSYERRGALKPERDSSGRRLYGDEDIEAARLFRDAIRYRPISEHAA